MGRKGQRPHWKEILGGYGVDQNTQAFVLGLAGIVATLVSSGLGLYYVARARTSPLREALYEKQLGHLMDIMRVIGRIRVYVTITVDPENDDVKIWAENHLRATVSELSQLEDISAAILPVEIYFEIKVYVDLVTEYLVDYDSNEKVNKILDKLNNHAAKIGLLARVYLGIDELSVESAKLFMKIKHIKKLSEINTEELIRRIRKE